MKNKAKHRTKGAFGKVKNLSMKRCSCYRCDRNSKFTKKNFPMPVVVEKKTLGYLCKVCIRKAYMMREKKRMEREAKEKLKFKPKAVQKELVESS